MTKARLHADHKVVVHSSKHRTRLRIPKAHRQHARLHEAQNALQRIPGVRAVEINSETGSVLIHHDESEQLFDEISSALEESAPEILMALLIPGEGEAELGLGVLSNLFKKIVAAPEHANGGNGVSAAAGHQNPLVVNDNVRRYMPLAFIGIGIWQMIREEALLSGIAPVALFYYGFDLYWKLQQDTMTRHIEQTTDALPTQADLEKHRAPRGS
jgi:hypothetical protein